jgi:hypothetical protein
VVFGVLLLALQSQSVYDGFDQSSYMEKRLLEWKPAASYLAPSGLPQSDPQRLVGEWCTSMGWDGTSVTFLAPKEGASEVTFTTGGCLGKWTLKRAATLKDGLVRLDKAVQSYCGKPYDRFFFLLRNGELCLVPAGAVEQAQDLGNAYPAGGADKWIEYDTLRKREYRKG